MDPPAATPGPSRANERPLVVRVSVLGVVLAGVIALGSAAVLSGAAASGAMIAATLIAVAGGVTWLYAPRVGFWLMLLDSLAVLVVAGLGLASGPVPWMLVAFWGGSAVLLGALLHLISDSSPGRSTTVTLVAVISLLVLSAIGLTAYVQATWGQSERAVLQRITALTREPSMQSVAWVKPPAPAPSSGWCCSWLYPGTPSEALAAVRSALQNDGWRMATSSVDALMADKLPDQVSIQVTEAAAPVPSSSATFSRGVAEVTLTVRRVTALTYH